MIIRLLLALAALTLIYWVFKRWRTLPPGARRQALIKTLVIAALLACVLAVLTGRLHWLGAVVAGLAALLKFGLHTIFRALPFLNILRRSPFFDNPRFKTAFLEVNINLKNGQIFGRVLGGPLAGKSLAELTQDELEQLENYYQDKDKPSFYLIRGIRQRGGHSYHQEQRSYQSGTAPSIDEALQILGLNKNPSKQEVIKAHRSLMQKLHPDRGGNDYLAARVNLAKEVLLKHLEKT